MTDIRREMRAGETDREHVIETLNAACFSGHIDPDELSARLDQLGERMELTALLELIRDVPASGKEVAAREDLERARRAHKRRVTQWILAGQGAMAAFLVAVCVWTVNAPNTHTGRNWNTPDAWLFVVCLVSFFVNALVAAWRMDR